MGVVLIFEGFTNLNDDTLWYSNGDATGTLPITINGDGGSVIGGSLFGDELSIDGPILFSYGGIIYFNGDVPDGGGLTSQGLWVSQATTASTKLIDSGGTGSGLNPQDFVGYAGKVYFDGTVSAGLGISNELFVTNGTAAGTSEITTDGLAPSAMAVYDNLLFMNGANGIDQYSETQYGLFTYNANGGAVTQVGPTGSNAQDPLGFNPQDLVAAPGNSLFGSSGNYLFMSGMDLSGDTNLYVYANGKLSEVTTAPSASLGSGGLSPEDIVAATTPIKIGSVVFDYQAVYFSGVDASGNRGLWTSNGTSYSTGAIGNSGPTEVTASSVGGSNEGLDPLDIVTLNGDVYFTGYDNALGADADQRGLFVFDPVTNKTTELVTSAQVAIDDANAGAWGDLTPNALTVYDGAIYFDGHIDGQASAANQQLSLWSFTPVVKNAGTSTETISGTAQRIAVSDNGAALTPLYLTTLVLPEPHRDAAGIGYKSSYEAIYRMAATGGTLKIIDTANGDAVVDTIDLSSSASLNGANYSGGLFSLSDDGAGGTEIDFLALSNVIVATGDVLVSNVAGQPFEGYEEIFSQGVYEGADYFYASPADSAYATYDEDYSAGNSLIGSRFFYADVTDLAYTGYEYDFNGAGALVRAAYTGDATDPFSSFEYDYVGGVYSGAKYTFTQVASGATYSSYELDTTAAGALLGEKFYFSSGEEEDFDANGKLARVLLTGITGQPYSSLEADYDAGVYVGSKVYYTGVVKQSYTNEEIDVSASNQIEKVIYSGMAAANASTPTSIEQDYAAGAVVDTVYNFTNVSGATYYAYDLTENAKAAPQQETFDLNNGGHTLVALAGGQTLTSLGDDKMTGSGATTFVLNAIYGADTITNLASGDTVSLSQSEFSGFSALLSASANDGHGNVVISAADGDTLTLKNLTTTALAGMSADFSFHA